MSKVLIVEDEEKLVSYLIPLLQNRGYEVCWAADGKQALEMCPREKPESVLLDLGLPGEVSGYDVLTQIKQDTPHTKVVVITGYSEEHVKNKTISLGADLFFKKPFIPHKLFSALERLLKEDAGREQGNE